ncbi:MAG: HlyC/CorC family transporter [Caulobacteraceae bacterium]|nr:HlyC/CorC family transporter [Caulobacteraceae bacterium]
MRAEVVALAPVLICLLAVSAVFSAAETALVGASRNRMHQLERDGDRAAGRVNRLIGDQEKMIGAILLGANVINILASVLTTEVLAKAVPGALGVVISTAVMTALVLIFAEVLPKTLAIFRSDDIARILSGPATVVVTLLGPIVSTVQWLVRRVLRLFGVRLDAGTDVLAAHEEIRGAVEYHHAEGLVESRDRRMLGGVLDLAELDVSEVMVHRRQIVMLDVDAPAAEVVREALDSPYTRLPLYRHDPENVVGVLHAKDVARAIAGAGDLAQIRVAEIATEPWFIPETTNLKDQLNAFLKRRTHFALVVDEYGALQGLVTLEDILEEIVGEIEDEHDLAIEGVRRQPDASVVVDGQVTIRDLNRALDWNLPDEHAVTVAGLVIHEAQTIPDPGQTFIFHGHRFQVLRRQRNQITALRVGPPAAPEDDT